MDPDPYEQGYSQGQYDPVGHPMDPTQEYYSQPTTMEDASSIHRTQPPASGQQAYLESGYSGDAYSNQQQPQHWTGSQGEYRYDDQDYDPAPGTAYVEPTGPSIPAATYPRSSLKYGYPASSRPGDTHVGWANAWPPAGVSYERPSDSNNEQSTQSGPTAGYHSVETNWGPKLMRTMTRTPRNYAADEHTEPPDASDLRQRDRPRFNTLTPPKYTSTRRDDGRDGRYCQSTAEASLHENMMAKFARHQARRDAGEDSDSPVEQ